MPTAQQIKPIESTPPILGKAMPGVHAMCGIFAIAAILFSGCAPTESTLPLADDSQSVRIIEANGRTMGTTYMVKLANPPAELPDDWQLVLDAELRNVNDQMSTYLESSEISRFNRSESTDWFPVSQETADVVAAAQEISEETGGAFDVTVAPLVNAWSFGPGKRTQEPPTKETIADLRKRIGYEHLSVQMSPPALRKAIPELSVDLSAIAKGHGVDRLVLVLKELNVEHAFVDIGGEVRLLGDRIDRPWGVGIQVPDGTPNEVVTALPLSDAAIATSGDYRNYFDSDGERYSHTIDPRTGYPVKHDLASVSVIAESCMLADGWATAINVLGGEAGRVLAVERKMDVMLIRRQGDSYQTTRTGIFETGLESLKPSKGTQ
ncbi:FAD:protein FMN transferase [Roseimaritima multifibrata]|nr:FAD:protein FMN transferase [Roseimaritima multifibrata]